MRIICSVRDSFEQQLQLPIDETQDEDKHIFKAFLSFVIENNSIWVSDCWLDREAIWRGHFGLWEIVMSIFFYRRFVIN